MKITEKTENKNRGQRPIYSYFFGNRALSPILIIALFIFSGCAGLKIENEYFVTELPEPEQRGVYHKVSQGETLWRIAKTYGVSINDIIAANNIPNAAQVEKDQLVFIPGVDEVKVIIVDAESNKNDFIWPVKGRVGNYFHQKKGNKLNKGIDIYASSGDAVRASRSGHVVLVDDLNGYGKTVILDHSDGYYSLYSHNGKVLVSLGDFVLKNQEIAYVGRSNKMSFLHFEIRKNAVENNPLYYLP